MESCNAGDTAVRLSGSQSLSASPLLALIVSTSEIRPPCTFSHHGLGGRVAEAFVDDVPAIHGPFGAVPERLIQLHQLPVERDLRVWRERHRARRVGCECLEICVDDPGETRAIAGRLGRADTGSVVDDGNCHCCSEARKSDGWHVILPVAERRLVLNRHNRSAVSSSGCAGLQKVLMLQTVRSPRDGLEPFRVDRTAVDYAFAKPATANPLERVPDMLEDR